MSWICGRISLPLVSKSLVFLHTFLSQHTFAMHSPSAMDSQRQANYSSGLTRISITVDHQMSVCLSPICLLMVLVLLSATLD